MSRFVLEDFEIIKGNIKFFKLRVNQVCPIDEFWTEIENQGNLSKQLNQAIAIMERFSQNMPTSPKKFKNISRKKDPVSLYEVKTKDLRIYLFRNSSGAVTVFGGKKSTQKKDIKYFRSLTTEFIKSRLL
ncbi:MAG: hypothetical protein RIA63_12360 [Cyclobacteriaceae bacterium]